MSAGRMRERYQPVHSGDGTVSGVRARWLTGFAVGAAALFGLYWRQARSGVLNSDAASIILQSRDMLHGNLLLHGWITADVSFYSTELVQYALLQTMLPMGAAVKDAGGAMTYTLLVAGAALLAKGRAAGREGLVRALLAAGIMLAPALGGFTGTLLHAPDHTGSAVPVLAAWLVIDRCRPRWYVPVAVTLLLAWGAVGDPLIEITGAAAIAVACGVRTGRRLLLAREASREAASPPWFEPSLVASAAVSAVVAAAGRWAITAAGGFASSPVNQAIGLSGLWRNAPVAGKGLLGLFGAAFWSGHPPAWQLAFDGIHLAGSALALAGLLLALRRFFGPDALLTAGLAAGIVLNVGAWMASGYVSDLLSSREAAAVLPFAAVCAGRLLSGPVLRARSRGPSLALAGVGAAYVTMLAVNAAVARPAVPPTASVASWLAARHLTSGLATDYWLSNVITAQTRNGVRVREAVVTGGRVSRPAGWEIDTRWYDPADSRDGYLLTDAAYGSAEWRSQVRAARATFGAPARVDRVDGYTVLTWPGNILSRLRSAP